MDDGSPTDADLLERWRAGDRQAGDELTSRHYAAIQKFVRRKLDDRGVVQEIVQETWLALVEARENIRDGLKFRGFLNCIASRRVYRWYQSRGLGEGFDPEKMSHAEASSSLPARLQIQKAETKLLYRALRELPAEEQLTLELFNWEEQSAPDIAELMGTTLATVKHRLRRGREKLEALIVRYQKQPGGDVETGELLTWFAELQRRGADLDAERK